MSKPPVTRVTALRKAGAPQALSGHRRRRVLSRRPWPRAHAEFFLHRRPCTCVARWRCAAKCFFACTACVQSQTCSIVCGAHGGYRVISTCTDPDGTKKCRRNRCPPCIEPTPLLGAPESRSPTTPESDLTIAFRFFPRSSFVHVLVRHDRPAAAAILEPAGAG